VTFEAFLDTGAFIAWLVQGDARHAQADELFSAPPRRLATSILVVSEAYGWFLHRFGEQQARLFRLAVRELPGLSILPVEASHHEAVERKLERLRGQKLTYVDASSLVLLEQLRIKVVWGTDHHLGIEGARVVPGA
jgi:predicted nucleic acid-binding protein